jgi:hypothetical protein
MGKGLRGLARTLSCVAALAPLPAAAAQERAATIYTTHFFDWYRVTSEQPYAAHQRVWTFRPDWEGIGLRPDEVGVNERYYAVQFEMIRKAGFDGIHYEWFGQQPSAEFLRAMAATKTRVAMFYDQEIRFVGKPAFIKPTDAFRAEVVRDVASFYERIPRELRLLEADGSVPLIFYGYQFDQSVRSVETWHAFYQGLLDDLGRVLGAPPRIYWTDSGALCETYAFQRFPEIHSFSFAWWGAQRQLNPASVTFVMHYDDKGAGVGGRAARSAAYDPRFAEEHLGLARMSSPRLVFNYGWNEFYEGENILPDRTWGRWRLDAMAAIVGDLRKRTATVGPPVLLLMDDLYAHELRTPGSSEALHALTGAYRYLWPQSIARVQGGARDLPAGRPVVLSLSRDRTEAEERELVAAADSGRARVVFFTPDPRRGGPLVARFASGPRTRPVEGFPMPPANQWVGAEIKVDVDAARYPFLGLRVRNSPNTFYHVRVIGEDSEGVRHENHDNQSPLDWRVTAGDWQDRRENMKAVVEAYAGKPIRRFVGVVVIVNGVATPGDFSADVSEMAFCDASGAEKVAVPLGDAARMKYRASFENTGAPGFPFGAVRPARDAAAFQLHMKARYATDVPLDATTQSFTPRPGAQVLAWAAWPPPGAARSAGMPVRVPLVLKRGNLYWVNTLAPHLGVYGPLMAALGMPRPRMAHHLVFQGAGKAMAEQRSKTPTVVPRAELPLQYVRLYHPADMPDQSAYLWPATTRPLAAVRRRAGRAIPEPVTVVIARGRVEPVGMARLDPGDVLDVWRAPVRVIAEGTVRVTAARRGAYVLRLEGRGSARVKPTGPHVRLLRNGKPVRGAVRLPCVVTVSGP